MSREKLFEVADRQVGYFTSKQAEECGYSRSNFHRYLNSGEWMREMRGVYRLSHYPVQDRCELALLTVWSFNRKGEPQGVISHETALDIYELTDVMPSKIHMTVPKSFRRFSQTPQELELHYAELLASEIQQMRGYLVTTPLRALIDCMESIALDQIELGAKQALQRGLISHQDIKKNPFISRFFNEI